jgi:serine/threonine-protein kinase
MLRPSMLQPGDTFERYTVEALIGQGGMGSVYRAQDTRLGRRVALKVISDRVAGPHARERLLREALAAAALDHPNAIAIFDVGEIDGGPYIVMELCAGRTLRAEIGDQSVPLSARLTQLADIGRALAGAHRRGLVHRDIKPENVMIRDDGMVKVLDFGIARRTSGEVDPAAPTQTPALPTLTIEGIKLGTPVYMAPEQIKGDELDGRADQFAWGVVAYELLAGRLPWRGGDALAAMASALTDPIDRAPLDAAGVPRPVQDVVLRALEKRPEQRFATMDEAVKALEAAMRGEPPAPAPSLDPEAARPSNATAEQRFSTGEVREVLGKAIEKQAARQGTTKLGFEELLGVAAEVGVDEESLREASRALRRASEEKKGAAGKGGVAKGDVAKGDVAKGDVAKGDVAKGDVAKGDVAKGDVAMDELPGEPRFAGGPRLSGAARAEKAAAWVRRQRRNFLRHAGIYAILNAAILFMGFVLLPFTPWWIWILPAITWGIGVAIHGLVAFTAHPDDWEVEDERMQWWLEEGRRRHQERLARSGAALQVMERMARRELPGRGGAPGRGDVPGRIATGGEARGNLRVAGTGHDTDHDLAAEEEAASLEKQQRGRGRR